MSAPTFAFFDTALGACAIVWRADAILATQLPDVSEAMARVHLARRAPLAQEAAPAGLAAQAITRIRALLEGGRDDLADIPVAPAGIATFERAVYAAARTIAPGQTRSYGEIAAAIGAPGAARAVGRALGANPLPIIVPCHRVLAARGAKGGFSAPGGVTTKMRMLEIEGALGPASLPLFSVQH